MPKKNVTLIVLGLSLLLFAAGCKKKAPAPPPPPPPPPPEVKEAPKAPNIVSFSADPASIQRGSSSTLRWQVENATEVSIDQGIGAVPPSGSRQVFPNSNTTYTLTAKGPGGSATRSVTVTVTVPPPPPPPPAPKERSLEEWVADVEDAYFDFDKSDIREDARAVLTRNADILKTIFGKFPAASIVIEGHCDERGSAEYNLGLGDRRATSAKEFLVQLGVPGDKLRTISYGKERPQCTESTEECWQKNRRVHFAVGQ